jgi:hypothetical protein
MHLVQILLPLADNEGRPFPTASLDAVRRELTERFGGLTAFTRAPAEGFWEGGEGTARDDVVVLEVMADTLDAAWWAAYRHDLETRFSQDAIVVRAQEVRLL